tara:strand:- start:128929 stop:129033 length:105 start_codon:yes stop_codon:yes gene_type:complete
MGDPIHYRIKPRSVKPVEMEKKILIPLDDFSKHD